MKQFLIKKLQNRVRKLVNKHKPIIIAVTGSVGKTSTKEAIKVALEPYVNLRSTVKNYNNEIGVPLSILGENSPGKSIWGWLRLLNRARKVKRLPDVLLLEYGADHPGDIGKLCGIAKPSIAVVTGVSSVHAEYFTNIEEIAAEKASIVGFLASDNLAVLNVDDKRVSAMAQKTTASVLTYGVTASDYQLQDITISTREDESFEPGEVFAHTSAYIEHNGTVIAQLKLKNKLGYAPAMACAAAIAVADYLGIGVMNAVKELNKHYGAVPGRLNPIPGIKGSLIIDDSYNAAPTSMQNGLKILKMFRPGEEVDRRIAVLGAMAELGQYSDDEHRMIGLQVATSADIFVAVGEVMHSAVDSAKEAGMGAESIEWFGTSEEAGRYLDRIVQQGDIVFVKGSQSARMEKVVKDIMAEPLSAPEVLVRQEPKWLNE
ncbi:hypothetical protein CO173_02460 [Candidatus Uhrbacteria bacterium CG_4_9_14_3_um_filter_41_35]|uniref:UDP-N-acetylmuramoyl-tripeptide--D-alanyl-D-alanine ligase n=1 Tax=Candidatus Uhrbacteria bacterium CG_4_9_14_3_um_filter_41_35 TaxID=1975034 RepID=A0A2M7XFG8_9BACT|nr:MAG: hypothetical protein COV92_01680 [Candidatus Uhrbacteria bacterium CG11_big_fil_rev_8_21_14_0_20_41_9]PJA46608.1 MAG: hypothetical protein CO173_02460 [Candidatus Uhrbacteria bacterium CG_4_9_14_3_um_filter_41_35]